MTSMEKSGGGACEAVPEKIKMWERKLLDLSLRNALINLKPNRNCLPLAVESGRALQALLLQERELALCPWMPRTAEADGLAKNAEDADAFEVLSRLEPSGLPYGDCLWLFSEERSMHKLLKRLYRSAKTAMDESGVGTLFIGLGMLRWTDDKGQPRLAPLVLIPVAIECRRLRWTLSLREGDADVNITLLEKLLQEYGISVPGAEPLPRDNEGGIDLEKVYDAFRRAVGQCPDWTVLDQSALANFSYGAFVMWNDLCRREARLMENPITRSLVTGIRMPQQRLLQMEEAPFLPLDADATQLEAICAARRGESFVLHGPPGTGKSQTITSMIANLLADGRRVLFVAEKQAALEVVNARLDAIGLGPYCLALYATGASTRSALDQLQRMIEAPEPPEASAYGQSLALSEARTEELDALDRALHTPMGCGLDLYTAIQRYEGRLACPDIEPPDAAYMDALTNAGLEEARRMLARLAAAGRAVGHPARYPLRKMEEDRFTPSGLEAMEADLRAGRAALEGYAVASAELAQRLGQPHPATQAEYARLSVMASDALFWEPVTRRGLRQLSDAQWVPLMNLINHRVNAGQLRAGLSRSFRPEFLEQDGAALYEEWRSLSGNSVFNRLRLAGLMRRVNAFALKPIAEETLWAPLRALANLQAEEAAAREDIDRYLPLLGEICQGENTDWIALQKQLSEARAHARQFSGQGWLTPLRERLLADPEAMSLARRVEARRSEINALGTALDETREPGMPEGDWIAARIAHCDAALNALGKAGNWLAWLSCARQARQMGLENAVSAYEAGMDPDELWPAFEKALCGALIQRRVQSDPALSQFTGRMTDALSEEFRALDGERARLSRQALVRRLYERRRGLMEAAAQTPDLSRLRRACAARRSSSLRRLFEQIPDLTADLAGCMLMNPVSIAQFLPENMPDFDVVVFDEASQLLTSRAVGALSRARATVVVGDPKQMPPTTFFAAQAVQTDDEDLEDLESVLDDCLSVGLPSRRLNWHYRSRHESLIDFANRSFYEGRLTTFPSADARTPHVRAVFVNGVFDRGGSRVNRIEAQAVVDELVRRACDPERSASSVGVITFNLAQQNLIEDMVSAEAVENPALATWLEQAREPIFIKNLENVQGDERDAILLSVGYGPDASGAIHMNFGPLNRDGGWRRLNVAVTRAREEMLVFTSVSSGDIRSGAATARGVSALKEFLDYAAGGGVDDGVVGKTAPPDGIADALCRELTDRGWRVERSVGRSDFHVSVAVVDPDDPGRYRLGILLDESTGASARDREITRPALLRHLGWSLTRLYALDWRRSRNSELRRVLELLGEAPKC